MTDMNLPNNSSKARQGPTPAARPKMEKVVQTEVVKRKKPLGRKVRDTFTNEDARSVGQFIVMDVIVPSVKDLVYEIVMQALGRSMYGNVAARGVNRFMQGPQTGPGGGQMISYNLMAKPQAGNLRAMAPDGPTAMTTAAQSRHAFEELVFNNRGEAEVVLSRLQDVINEYRMVSVSELYELIGHPTSHTDNKYGWYNLAGAGVQQVHRGFVLTLPKPVVFD